MSSKQVWAKARDAERRAEAVLDEASTTREAAARAQDAAARNLANYLVDHLADVLAGVPVRTSLTAEYVARRAAWREACKAYMRAFDRWKVLYEQRKRLEDDDC